MAEFGFYEGDKNRYIHVIMPSGDGEHTACGMAFDISSDEKELGEWVTVSSKTVTCPDCIGVVEDYRGIRTKKSKEP